MKDQSLISDQKVMVTGASGYIGPHLCHRLLHIGANVFAVSRTSPSITNKRLQWYQTDLSDFKAVQKLLKHTKPDVIFHLAGYAVGGREIGLVLPTFHSNLTSTVNLLIGVTEFGSKKIILSGSLEEPDEGTGEQVPSSPYAAGKWAASGYARMFHRLYGTPIVNLRLFMTYGPGKQAPNKLVPYVIKSLLNQKAPKLSSGQREIDWIFIDDVIDGIITSAEADDVLGCTIDIGSGKAVSIQNLVQKLIGIIDPKMKALYGALAERPIEQVKVADMQSTYKKIGWKPTISLDEGLAKTVEWYRSIS
jgi:nucleoside-diphosphate-sugar epimerase